MKRLAILAIATGCTVGDDPPTKPAAEPPSPWGVPISGGTMLVTRDGTHAVIADPDRDRIVTVNLVVQSVLDRPLPAGSEPGRLVEDGAGRIHVALRGTGELLTLDAGEPLVRPVCAEPRGLAWDAASDLIHVACATGELVSMPAAGGPETRRVVLERDLRDVVVRGTQLAVTRFRGSELLALDASGAIVERVQPPTVRRAQERASGTEPTLRDAVPAVAWRTVALPDGRLLTVHQRKIERELRSSSNGYLGSEDCGQGPIESAISLVTPGAAPIAVAPLVRGALPVDVAVDATGEHLAFALAGGKTVQVIEAASLGELDDNECGRSGAFVHAFSDDLGAPTSVAYRPNGELLVFYPELPALVIHTDIRGDDAPRTIRLPGELGYDAGRGLFHAQTRAGLACASCHPEGREDGQTWRFADLGPRRTQSLAGAITARAPYHWLGDLADLPTLMETVFVAGMGGVPLTRSQQLSLGPWLDRVTPPAPRPATDAAAVLRGQVIFLSGETECIQCHVGPLYSNNAVTIIGARGALKVPSLVGVGGRAPFMHDGCAASLGDIFTTCGIGDAHGKTSQLTPEQRADLVAFLETL